MQSTLIIAHPYSGSFNHVLFELVRSTLEQQGREVKLIDLYRDGFIPQLSAEELRVYNRPEILDPLVKRYQAILKETEELVLVFPIWWYEAPAMMKGFIDKVMTPGFAFDECPSGLIGKLNHIRRTTVITTSEVETAFMRTQVGNPIETSLMKTTLDICGIRGDVLWLNCEHIASGSEVERQDFMAKVKSRIEGICTNKYR